MGSNHLPPHWGIKFLRWFVPTNLYEGIEGDLLEKYEEDLDTIGEKRARRRFVWNVIRFFRPGILLRNKFSMELIQFGMVQHYIRISYRHLVRDKVISAINILGLSLSMAACLLIFQYAQFELSYDSFHENADRLYRVSTYLFDEDEVAYPSALSSHQIGAGMESDFPEVINSARLMPTNWFSCMLRYDNGNESWIFNEPNLYYADASFFSVLTFPLKYGDPQSVLENPFSAVISETTARRYFGEDDAIGKVLHLKGSSEENDYTVTGVMFDIPENSHMKADILMSLSSLEFNEYFKEFEIFAAYTYLLMSPEADIASLRKKFTHAVNSYIQKPSGINEHIEIDILPVTDLHHHAGLLDELKPVGNLTSVYFLLFIAVFILVIAWINYVNLATSRMINRAKEVGVRKVSGANRLELIKQFLTESVLVNLCGVAIALILCITLSQAFYKMAGLSVYPEVTSFGLNNTGLLILLIFVTGIFLSGLYPASIVSSFRPAWVLKGKFSNTNPGLLLKKGLVVVQFTCAIMLMTGMFALHHQFQFMQHQDLGVDIHNTLVIKAPSNVDSTYLTQLKNFKEQLQGMSLVKTITSSTGVPGEKIGWVGDVRKEQDRSVTGRNFGIHVVDTDFIDAFGLTLLAGRNFMPSEFPDVRFGNKTESVILNKEATRQLGFNSPEEALNSFIYWGENRCVVIGVLEDFHQASLKNAIQPTLFTVFTGPSLSLKLSTAFNKEDMTASMDPIKKSWDIFFPDNAFDYFFLEDFYQQQYHEEKQMMSMFNFFSALAIVISCLGLYGLASLAARQRTKEVGIRKVLGASVMHLIALLSKDFMALVLLAGCIALPISFFGVSTWLENYAYRMDISGWLFIIPMVLAGVLALLTVTAQTIRTAGGDPVDALKCE